MPILKLVLTLISVTLSASLYENLDNARQIFSLYPQVATNFISTCRDCTAFGNEKAKACKGKKAPEISNFLRHVCWQANLTYWHGAEVARGIGDIHEGIVITDKMTAAKELDGCIDQANNVRGRKIGKEVLAGLTGLNSVTYSTVMRYTKEEILRTYADYCLGQPKTICPDRLTPAVKNNKAKHTDPH